MNFSLALISLFAALIPMVSYMIAIWLLDRYDREPVWLVALNFSWGAFGAIIIGLLGSQFFERSFSGVIFNAENKDFFSAILTAPFIEEIAKGLFLLFVTAPLKDFDNMTDGVVYGAAIGLGFGMTENFLYFLNIGTMQEWVILVPIRSILSAVMHACSTSALGAFIGYSKFQSKNKKYWVVPVGLLVAIFIHFVWNFSVTYGAGKLTLIGVVFIFISVIIMFALFESSLSVESKLIKRELTDESERGLIPTEHLNYLPYTHLRSKKGWLPENVDQTKYLKVATTLAFRKQQFRNCSQAKKAFYEQEVHDAREEISHLLHRTPM